MAACDNRLLRSGFNKLRRRPRPGIESQATGYYLPPRRPIEPDDDDEEPLLIRPVELLVPAREAPELDPLPMRRLIDLDADDARGADMDGDPDLPTDDPRLRGSPKDRPELTRDAADRPVVAEGEPPRVGCVAVELLPRICPRSKAAELRACDAEADRRAADAADELRACDTAADRRAADAAAEALGVPTVVCERVPIEGAPRREDVADGLLRGVVVMVDCERS